MICWQDRVGLGVLGGKQWCLLAEVSGYRVARALFSACTLPCVVLLQADRVTSYSANGQFLASLPVPPNSQITLL